VIGNSKSTGTVTALIRWVLVAYSKEGLTPSVSTRSFISTFSAHSSVAGTFTGETPSSGGTDPSFAGERN